MERSLRSALTAGNTLHNSNSYQLASADGPAQTRVVSHQLPFRSEPYTLSYFTDKQQTSGQSDKQTDRRHSGRGGLLISILSYQSPCVTFYYDFEGRLQQVDRIFSPDEMTQSVCMLTGSGLAVRYSEEGKLQQWFDACAYVTLEPNSYSRRILNDQVRPRQHMYKQISCCVLHTCSAGICCGSFLLNVLSGHPCRFHIFNT